jgi:hypothetical protein
LARQAATASATIGNLSMKIVPWRAARAWPMALQQSQIATDAAAREDDDFAVSVGVELWL